MEKKLNRAAMLTIAFFCFACAFAQQMYRQEYTVIPIDSIYLENKDNLLALSSITTKNVQSILGEPINIRIFEEEWSDEYDRQATYEYELLTVRFRSYENAEWLHYIQCSSSDISVIINGVRLFAGTEDSALRVFEKSWEIYKDLENTKEHQDRFERGDTEKTFILKFPIKKGNYEYLGLIYIGIKDDTIIRVRFFLQDEA